MVLTLPSFGKVFCSICPHAFLGKQLQKIGLNRRMPKWMDSPYWGLGLILMIYWSVLYLLPGTYKNGLSAAILFLVLTLFAVVIYYLFKDMGYCKTFCPIGAITRSYAKVAPTQLGSYESACHDCKTFECAKACDYGLSPFKFASRNNMGDCTLCMDCANSCEAINFKVTQPAKSLVKPMKHAKTFEIWTFLWITAAATITMQFHHALGRTAIAPELPWNQSAAYFTALLGDIGVSMSGLFSFMYAIAFTMFLGLGGLWIASKLLKKEFNTLLLSLGYSFAPLMIIGAFSHILPFFFYHYYSDVVNGFIWAFSLPFEQVSALATRRDAWLRIFEFIPFIAVIFSWVILIRQMKLLQLTWIQKVISFPFAGALSIGYLAVVIFKIYAFATFGMASHH
jgi:hypothetical protein